MPVPDVAFVSLADILRNPVAPIEAPSSAESVVLVPLVAAPLPAAPVEPTLALTLRDARLFRAALADAFDGLVASVANAVATEILARELHLAAVDVEALARRLIAERYSEEPLHLRVAPADAHITCDIPLIADPELEPGDAILQCQNGTIDARLAVRLAHVLATVEW